MGAKEFLAVVLALTFGGSALVIAATMLFRRVKERQVRSLMVFRPPVKTVRLQRKDPTNAETYRAELLLTFAVPEEGEVEEVATPTLTFNLNRNQRRYFFALGQIFSLLGCISQRGLGEGWTEAQKKAFWAAVEDGVSGSILLREEGMQALSEKGR